MIYACKICKRLLKSKKCSKCNSTDVTDKWKGSVTVFDPDKSEIAKKMELTLSGSYALKVK
jgi:DNA-directed RNA polymerase subunit E"